MCKLDRLRLSLAQNPTEAFLDHPVFHSLGGHRLKKSDRFQPYTQAHWFEHRTSGMKFSIESKPPMRWIPPYRITLFGDDKTGLLPEEVFGVLELLVGGFKLTLVEIALDFEGTKVNRSYIRRYGLFGRSQPKPSGKVTDYWGTRKGSKLAKSYWKSEIGRFRLELELRSRFLRRHNIEDPYDFQEFAQMLPRHHVWFTRIDDLKLIDHLRRRGLTGEEIIRICRHVDALKKSIHAALSYLHRKVRINNVRRVLTPLRTNQLVRGAFTKFSADWPEFEHAPDEGSGRK